MDYWKILEFLKLEPHPLEGGYFRRTYQSKSCHLIEQQRYCASAIYYMLTPDENRGYLHRNRSDILHFYHIGDPALYLLLKPDGVIETKVLGPDLNQGHCLQLLVPGGVWKASKLMGTSFSLITEVVVPGFDYADNELATRNSIRNEFPQQYEQLKEWIKN